MTTRVAYLVSRFPRLTETFIVNEIAAVKALGVDVDLYSLVHEDDVLVQDEAARLEAGAHFGLDGGATHLVRTQLHWLRRRPRTVLGIWWRVVRGNLRSPRFLARSLMVVPMAMAFATRMEAAGTDRIHAHFATHPALAAHVVNALTGIDYVVTVHAHDLYVNRTMLREKLEGAAAIIAISDYNKRLMTELWPDLADRIHVIHCGVDLSRWTAAPSPDPDRHDARPVLLAVGSLQAYKGHRHLIDACAELRDRGRDFVCIIAGRGELEDELRAQIRRLDLTDVVRLAGAKSSAEVRELMAEADVLVHPSIVTETGKTEGIPIVLMEALASHLPVVATDVSGVSELIIDDETGALVAPGDPTALATRVEDLLDDVATRDRLAAAGRIHVADAFDLDRNAPRIVELISPEGSSGVAA